MPRPICSLSLDLDDEWTYLKTHGDPAWESLPSYLPIAIPRILERLEAHGLRITFFIVGQDAALPRNHGLLRQIVASGHEVANHSFHHDPWLQRYSMEELEQELSQAENAIQTATGERPTGFRGPGFSHSPLLMETLARRGYAYDASTFPNFLNPLARRYFLRTSQLNEEEKSTRAGLFGSWRDGFRPNRPYYWPTDPAPLLEMPVTTMPIAKVPIHASYLLYLGLYSRAVALAYWQAALGLCRVTRTPPSILLHPLDFLGGDDTDRLAFFPAMQQPAQAKLDLMDDVFDHLTRKFEVMPMREAAKGMSS